MGLRASFERRPWSLAAVGLLVVACNRRPAGPAEEALPAASASAPIDHLAPGELLEGTDKAFALALPRGMKIERSFADSVFATAWIDADVVANYVRAHVQGGSITAGAGSTIFDGVHVPSEPNRPLYVRVARMPATVGCNLEVHDATPPPAQVFPTEPERWKAAGLTPDGKFIDPEHIQ